MAKGAPGYFTNDLFEFLTDLKEHNDRAWFAKNKTRYEAAVQTPALRFIGDAGLKLRSLSPHIVAEPKPFGGSLYRIYRDTRFSRDKSPYHTHVGIHFSHDAAGKEKVHLPGYFLHLDPEACVAYSGVWRPDGPALKAIRDAIVARPQDWKRATRTPVGLYGESLKRPPPGYDPGHPLIEDLKRKDFVGKVSFRPSKVAGPGFLGEFLGACRAMAPLNAFLAKALRVPW